LNFLNKIFIVIFLTVIHLNAQNILIPMDQTQTDHLKAYGIAFLVLTQNTNVEWLLTTAVVHFYSRRLIFS